MSQEIVKERIFLKKNVKNIILLILFSGFSGCTSTEIGATTGAISGAVIGGNTKGHHNGRRMAIGATLGALAGAGVGHAVQREERPRTGGWE